MDLILGVDGGNTKTIALLARTDGTIVGAGRAGQSDMYGTPSEEAALAEVECAIRTALAAAGADTDAVAGGGFNMAGADWPEDYCLLEEAIRERGLARRFMVVNDGLGPLWAGSPDGTGVAVVCGTGLAIGARAADGRMWHGSYWLDDHGAGDLARQGIEAVIRAELGIAPETSLAGRAMRHYGAASVGEMLHGLTRRPRASRPRAAPFAPAVLDEAQAGDAVAREIVVSTGEDIARYALVAARKVGLDGPRWNLVLAGGLFRHSSPLLPDAIAGAIRRSAPEIEVVRSPFEPVVGALLMGFEAAGIAVDEAIRARIAETGPSEELFASH